MLATTSAVAAVARWAIPSLSWPAAFVLGAVVAPTDEAAVIPVIERLGVPARIATVVADESLINDAVSLVIYRLAAAAGPDRHVLARAGGDSIRAGKRRRGGHRAGHRLAGLSP